jgi:hypothetical protein
MMMKTEKYKIPFDSPGTRSHSAFCHRTLILNTEIYTDLEKITANESNTYENTASL